MTSVLNVDTIAAKDGTSPVELTKQVVPKGFASTKNDGTEIYESFNISTLTDTTTGQQLLNLTNSFNGSTYMSNANANSSQNDWGHAGTITKTTSTCDTTAYDAGGSYQDNNMSTVFMGDLA